VGWESKHLLGLSPRALRERIDASEDFAEGGRPLVLFGPDQTRRAGAPIPFPVTAPVGRPFILSQPTDHGTRALFSQLTELPSGEYVLVSRSAKDLETLEKALVETFVWGMIATIVIGLIGAVVFGAGSLRQNDAITKAVERIMRGDLSERLPTRGVSADLAHLTRVVNDMLDQLQRLMLEIKGVNENIAHDLRTPLTRVVGTLERSLRKADSVEAFRACNEDVLAEVKSIVVRFSALLRISEMEDRLRRSGFTEVDLGRLLEDAVEYYEPLAVERGIRMRWERTDGPCLVEGDRSLIFEAASNLIDNALKFTPAGGEVAVTLRGHPRRRYRLRHPSGRTQRGSGAVPSRCLEDRQERLRDRPELGRFHRAAPQCHLRHRQRRRRLLRHLPMGPHGRENAVHRPCPRPRPVAPPRPASPVMRSAGRAEPPMRRLSRTTARVDARGCCSGSTEDWPGPSRSRRAAERPRCSQSRLPTCRRLCRCPRRRTTRRDRCRLSG
jgi:signal transduction histidine kinase